MQPILNSIVHIIIVIVIAFVVAALIRKKYPRNAKVDFWVLIVAIVVFSFMYVRELITAKIHYLAAASG